MSARPRFASVLLCMVILCVVLKGVEGAKNDRQDLQHMLANKLARTLRKRILNFHLRPEVTRQVAMETGTNGALLENAVDKDTFATGTKRLAERIYYTLRFVRDKRSRHVVKRGDTGEEIEHYHDKDGDSGHQRFGRESKDDDGTFAQYGGVNSFGGLTLGRHDNGGNKDCDPSLIGKTSDRILCNQEASCSLH